MKMAGVGRMTVASLLDVALGEFPGPVLVTRICQSVTERFELLVTVPVGPA
jgi:hypothetical protein